MNSETVKSWIAGNRKVFVAVIAMVVQAVVLIWGPDKGEQVDNTLNQLLALIELYAPAIIGIGFMVVNWLKDIGMTKATASAAVQTAQVQAVATTPAPTVNQQETPQIEAEAPSVPQPVQITPFDAKSFMERVMAKVGGMYGVINKCTTLYAAQSTYRNDWTFDNIKAERECADLLITLAKKAFREIWGTEFDAELNLPSNPEDCTLDNMKERALAKGDQHYAIYLQVVDMQKLRNSLG